MEEERYRGEELADIDKEDTSSNEIITQPFSPNDIELVNPPMNLGDLIDRIDYGWIDFNTEYQRQENLWSLGKQSRLIESALLGLRLPAFYFEEVNKKCWKVIDGLQRCCAIRNYCVEQNFSLCELEFLDFNGKKFNELPFDLRRDLRMLPITVNLLSKGVPDKVKYILFKRLNTGGMELKPQEIRNAVFQGLPIDTVKELAEDEAFRKATCYKIPQKRMQDQDFVTRFMAFYLLGFKDYQPDLDNYMNSCLDKIKQGEFLPSVIQQMKADFHKSMVRAVEIFGEDAFRKRESDNEKKRPINKAYFEVIAYYLAILDDKEYHVIKSKKDEFKQQLMAEMTYNRAYNGSFSSGTGRRDNVKRRFGTFGDIVNGFIHKQ